MRYNSTPTSGRTKTSSVHPALAIPDRSALRKMSRNMKNRQPTQARRKQNAVMVTSTATTG